MLQIRFNEIPEEGLRCNVEDVTWFPDREVARRGAPTVFVELKRIGERVQARGSIAVSLVFKCDRCLEEFVTPLEIDFHLVLEKSEPEQVLPEQQEIEFEVDSTQIEVLSFDGQLVDLGDLLYQQIILALPHKNLCREDCRGICGHCGANLNQEPCGCSDETAGSPFGALRQLLKNDK